MEHDRWLAELTEFLRIPSISTLPVHDADCRRAAEWVARDLRRLGCRDVAFLGSETHPVVWGVGPEVPGAPTLLIYGHYDVQPPDPLNEWTTPPFEPSVRDGRIYARGAADDKGQVFCLLRAMEASGTPPVNLRFMIEGEEEYGSKVLFDLLRREPERTRADVALVADMSYVAPGWPAVYTTLRGMCYAEITIRTAKHDLHSGEYGGAAPNAHEELCRLLTRLKGADGKINVPGLYSAVKAPSARERHCGNGSRFGKRSSCIGGCRRRRSPGSRVARCSSGSGRCRRSRSTGSRAALRAWERRRSSPPRPRPKSACGSSPTRK
jgi:acetylornithine deacetylase/succinyl-diaminopimelate desuccinylase-like protein